MVICRGSETVSCAKCTWTSSTFCPSFACWTPRTSSDNGSPPVCISCSDVLGQFQGMLFLIGDLTSQTSPDASSEKINLIGMRIPVNSDVSPASCSTSVPPRVLGCELTRLIKHALPCIVNSVANRAGCCDLGDRSRCPVVAGSSHCRQVSTHCA